MKDWTDVAIALPTFVNVAFAFAFGACAGSFVHVAAYRVPLGISVVSPPSRCPTCGFRLPWYDNVPIVAYLRLRGRCSACGVRIPSRYVWSEVGMGLLFALAMAVLTLPVRGSAWHEVGHGWWSQQGLVHGMPAFLAVFTGLSALAAMTATDARSFLIPVAIPTFASVAAFVLWPLAALLQRDGSPPFPLETPSWTACIAALGGMAGLAVSRVLLAAGVLPRSFADWDDFAAHEGDVYADYPFARREMVKEVAFVGPAVLLALAGAALAPHVPHEGPLPAPLGAFLAVATGFLVGGAIVWALRIVATLLLDSEALGLGDVHLLACVGAVFGWKVAVAGFLVAPFVGLAWWLVNLFRRAPMRVPYGPSLAVGSVVAWLLKPALAAVIAWGLSSMADLGGHARSSPGEALGVCLVLGTAATVAAAMARRSGGLAAAASIVLMLAAVVGWILAAPSRAGLGAASGAILAVLSLVGSVLCGSWLEEDPGPRTALRRILRVLAFAVVAVGVFLLVARPPVGNP
jgi:leader peptidase (prepilin peptidase)/N-methyltransferase